MKRRDFIRNNSILLGTLPLINLHSLQIIEKMNQEKYKFKIGKFNCTVFKDLMWKYQASSFFINAKEEELAEALKKYEINPTNIQAPFIAMLLEMDDRKILIDTGLGFSEDPMIVNGKEFIAKGRLIQLLNEEGIKLNEITDVIISHFHLDHVGGVFSEKNVLNFPNAKFHMPAEEWEFWHSSKSDAQPPLFKFFVEKNITPLSNLNVNFIKDDFNEILPGLTAVKAEGHTPGQIALIIGEKNDNLLYIADTFLHPLHIEKIDWRTSFDFDHDKAKQSRLKLLDLANEKGMLINAFHFNFPGLGRVEKLPSSWKWNYSEK